MVESWLSQCVADILGPDDLLKLSLCGDTHLVHGLPSPSIAGQLNSIQLSHLPPAAALAMSLELGHTQALGDYLSFKFLLSGALFCTR